VNGGWAVPEQQGEATERFPSFGRRPLNSSFSLLQFRMN
jgi:hypothetical protein